jgi:RimJ/RimL family protein N-acetyltransferase
VLPFLGREEPHAQLAYPPVALEGFGLQLVPFEERHGSAITEAMAGDEESFRYQLGSPVSLGGAEAFARWLIRLAHDGICVPYAVEAEDGSLLGYTRYYHLDLPSRTAHLGGTWYAPFVRGTHANTACKYLLFEHAFERAGINRLQIQSDVRNERSQRAIRALGATYEGINRAKYIGDDGKPRDTMVFAVLRTEWSDVSKLLLERIAAKQAR